MDNFSYWHLLVLPVTVKAAACNDRALRVTDAGPVVKTSYDSTVPLVGCVKRAYGFDLNGNRIGKTTRVAGGSGQSCAATAQYSTTRQWLYDSADRVLVGGDGQGTYSYDVLGRQTNVPVADGPGIGGLFLTYFDDDSVRSVSGNGTATTYLLDPEGRRGSSSATVGGVMTETVRHYADTSDNPAWATTTADGVTSVTKYVSSIGGDLGVEVTDGARTLTVSDPHGDVVTTIDIPDTGDAEQISGWQMYDEYGNRLTIVSELNPAIPQAVPLDTGTLTYGWVGAKQRALDASGLILMGARLYNSKTGLFTSTDPVAGGTTTTYAYPQDPINNYDLDGQFSIKNALKKVGNFVKNNWVDIALTAAAFVPVAGAAVTAVRAVRLVKAVATGVKAVRRAEPVLRASRPVTAVAGRIWSRRVVANPNRAGNGVRMFTQKGGGTNARVYRQSTKKGGDYGYSSNFEVGTDKGLHTYRNVHVAHSGPSRWPHIGGK